MTETIVQNENRDTREVSEVASSLINLLRSNETAAYVLGLKQGRTLTNWAEKGVMPSDPVMVTRLKVAESLALTVKEEVRPWVSGAWLISNNPHLGEHSPSELIQSLSGTAEDSQLSDSLHHAAEHFASLPE